MGIKADLVREEFIYFQPLSTGLDNQITAPQVYRAIVLKLTAEKRKYYTNSIPTQDLWAISFHLQRFQRCLNVITVYLSWLITIETFQLYFSSNSLNQNLRFAATNYV